jgi:hypothetical protein
MVVAGTPDATFVGASRRDSARPGITRKPRATRRWHLGRECWVGKVACKADDCRARPGEGKTRAFARQTAIFCFALQETHASGASLLHPRAKTSGVTILSSIGQSHQAGLGKACVDCQGTDMLARQPNLLAYRSCRIGMRRFGRHGIAQRKITPQSQHILPLMERSTIMRKRESRNRSLSPFE